MEKYYKKWFKILNIPAAILFVVVILVPFIMGMAYSFTAWRGSYFKGSEHWYGALVGFKNYIKVFHSQKFITSFIYTIKFTIVAVVVKNIVSLGMALMVRKVGKGKGFFRTVFFFPNLLGGLAMGFIWSFIFQNVYSLMLFGEDSPIHIPFLCDMLQDPNKAVFAMAIMATWQTAGYLMLIYLNGLNNIPEDLYEAVFHRRCNCMAEIPSYHSSDADAGIYNRIFPDTFQQLQDAGREPCPHRRRLRHENAFSADPSDNQRKHTAKLRYGTGTGGYFLYPDRCCVHRSGYCY